MALKTINGYIFHGDDGCELCVAMTGIYDHNPDYPHLNCDCNIEYKELDGEWESIILEFDVNEEDIIAEIMDEGYYPNTESYPQTIAISLDFYTESNFKHSSLTFGSGDDDFESEVNDQLSVFDSGATFSCSYAEDVELEGQTLFAYKKIRYRTLYSLTVHRKILFRPNEGEIIEFEEDDMVHEYVVDISFSKNTGVVIVNGDNDTLAEDEG